jgi:hypothetical protein
MNQRSATVFRDFLLLPLVWLLVDASCSSKKEDSSSEPFATLIESQVAPVAEFTGEVAVAKFAPQDAKNELILDEQNRDMCCDMTDVSTKSRSHLTPRARSYP